jgi:hypothetical protein
LVAVVSSVAGVDAAVRAGADLVDLGSATPMEIMAVQARYPDVGVFAAGAPADVVTDLAAARVTGARGMCAGIEAASASGLPASRLLVVVSPALVPQVSQAGWAAVVDADDSAHREVAQAPGRFGQAGNGETGSHLEDDVSAIAIAAVASWLGAAAVRTHLTGQVRRALDMTASIRGLRPPSRAVRGLA